MHASDIVGVSPKYRRAAAQKTDRNNQQKFLEVEADALKSAVTTKPRLANPGDSDAADVTFK